MKDLQSYNLTVILNPNFKNKILYNKKIDTKLKLFKSLRKLAEYSQSKFFLSLVQKSNKNNPRLQKILNKLILPSNLIWLDLDYNVDETLLITKLKRLNLKCFYYPSSSYYTKNSGRLRLCIVLKNTIDSSSEYKAVAIYLWKLLKLENIDISVYGSQSYFANTNVTNKRVLPILFYGEALNIPESKLIIDTRTKSAKKIKKTNIIDTYKDIDLYSFATLLKSFSAIKDIRIRNSSISLKLHNYTEQTEFGYYINIIEPWIIYHPSINKQPMYLYNIIAKNKKDRKRLLNFMKSFNYNNPLLKYLPKINKEINSKYLPNDIFEKFKNKPLLLVESNLGSGKTTRLVEFLKNTKKTIIFISVNQAQAITLHKSLLNKNISSKCYIISDKSEQSYNADFINYNKEFIDNCKLNKFPKILICGILSLHHLMNNYKLKINYDIVIIDEITTLSKSIINPVRICHNTTASFLCSIVGFHKLIENCKQLIGLDGYISKSSLKMLESIKKEKAYFIKNSYKSNKVIKLYFCNRNEPKLSKLSKSKIFINKFKRYVKKVQEEPKSMLIIPCSSYNKANEIYTFLRPTLLCKCVGNCNCLDPVKLIDRDTTQDLGMSETLRQLDLHIENNLKYLIYTPSITTGVSLDTIENIYIFQIFNNKHLSSHTEYQMLMRGRNAKEYNVMTLPKLQQSNLNLDINTKKIAKEKFCKQFLDLINSYPYYLDIKLYKDSLLNYLLQNKIGMGYYSLFCYLNVAYKKEDKTDIIKHFKNNNIDFLQKKMQQLIEWEFVEIIEKSFDEKFGEVGQYLNLLRKEGNQTILIGDIKQQEEDIQKNRLIAEKEYRTIQIAIHLELIDKVLNYKKEITLKSLDTLKIFIKNLVFSQKILDKFFNKVNFKTPDLNLILRILVLLNVKKFKTKSKFISNEKSVKLFDKFIDYGILETKESILYAIFNIKNINNNKKKIAIKKFFKLFFNIKSIKNKGIEISTNKELINSIKKVSMEHYNYLYHIPKKAKKKVSRRNRPISTLPMDD